MRWSRSVKLHKKETLEAQVPWINVLSYVPPLDKCPHQLLLYLTLTWYSMWLQFCPVIGWKTFPQCLQSQWSTGSLCSVYIHQIPNSCAAELLKTRLLSLIWEVGVNYVFFFILFHFLTPLHYISKGNIALFTSLHLSYSSRHFYYKEHFPLSLMRFLFINEE